MGLLDRLRRYLGDDPRTQRSAALPGRARPGDEAAVERYRYLLRTAPPDAVEEVHAEAFAKLTAQQRRLVFDDLSQHASAADRPATDDPRAMARSATRSEMRQPGFLERTLATGGGPGGVRQGPGLGTVIGGSLLGTIAGVVIGSAIADTLLPGIGDLGNDFGGQDYGSDVADGQGSDGGQGDTGGGFDDGGSGGGYDTGFDGGGFGDGDFGGGGDF